MLYICKYVHIVKKNKKKQKTVTCFPWAVLFFLGLNSVPLSLSFPSQTDSARKEKKGGATSVDSQLTGELVADLDLSGFSDPRSNGPVLFCFVMSSQKSIAAYPPTKR